jgi:hypothetical protein
VLPQSAGSGGMSMNGRPAIADGSDRAGRRDAQQPLCHGIHRNAVRANPPDSPPGQRVHFDQVRAVTLITELVAAVVAEAHEECAQIVEMLEPDSPEPIADGIGDQVLASAAHGVATAADGLAPEPHAPGRV